MDSSAALDLGTDFSFDVYIPCCSVQQLITSLNATTTLTTLTVCHSSRGVYGPHIQRCVVEPLCRCLANLRLQNEDHPLKAIHFLDVNPDVVRQYLVAMKQFGIPKVMCWSVEPFPVRFLVDFCHDNRNLKGLKLNGMTFTDDVAVDPIDGSATNLNLDKLILDDITFKTSFAATNFAHLLSHMSVSALQLGNLDDHVEYVEDSITNRIVSGFKMPSAEQLTLHSSCRVRHFRAALDAGKQTLIQLTVELSEYHTRDVREKLESLANMVRGLVKLNSLSIHTYDNNLWRFPPHQLLQALEACASVTEIHVNNGFRPDFTKSEVQQLRRITARNRKLGRFLANPSTFSNDKLLALMSQFNDCPSGLYMLTRRLPEIFSFQKGNSLFPLMEPNPTRTLRKRGKISYKY